MTTHKAAILLRIKTYTLSKTGECMPPALSDTKDLIFSIDGESQEDIENKTKQLLEKVKEWTH